MMERVKGKKQGAKSKGVKQKTQNSKLETQNSFRAEGCSQPESSCQGFLKTRMKRQKNKDSEGISLKVTLAAPPI